MDNIRGSIKLILVVGYGSMGRRRIRLILSLVPSATIICIDSNPERVKEAIDAGHRVVFSLEEGIKLRPDVAFVCTTPGFHADIIIPLLSAGIHVFTELNLTTDRYYDMDRLAEANNAILFISSTLVYKKQMVFFKTEVCNQNKPVTYFYHMGQYLPDWHPWESYKDFFPGKKKTNGIREIMAIQLPWIVRTFGLVKSVHVVRQKCTTLEIDFPDSFILSIEHENGNIGAFVVDIISRKATTHLEIMGEDLYIIWNGHNDDLFKLNLNNKKLENVVTYVTEEVSDGYSDIIAEEPYMDEVREFFSVVGGEKMKYGLSDDAYVLDLIDYIENRYYSDDAKLIEYMGERSVF